MNALGKRKPWELPERPSHVEHHYFIYDPKYLASEEGDDKFAPSQGWYLRKGLRLEAS